jgi:uncharacterized protein YdaU (DUF1376 family)
MDLRSNRGKIKAQKRPYMKLFTSDYRDGTYSLSFELQGFYMRILTLLADGEAVPSDARRLGVMMQCDPRTAGRLTKGLIHVEKLFEQDGLLKNPRIERDKSAELRGDFGETSAELQPDIDEKSGETFQKPESNQDPHEPYYGESHFHCQNQSPVDNQPTFLPRTGEKGVRGDGFSYWSKAINGEQEPEHKTVTLEGDRIVLHNGTRAKWLAKFGGDEARLDLALDQAIGWIQPNSPRPLEAQVSSQLAKTLGDKLDRDGRYERTAKSAPAAGAPKVSNARAILEARKAREVLT